MTVSPPTTRAQFVAYASGLAGGNLIKACVFSDSVDIKKEIINSVATTLLCASGGIFAKFFTENEPSTSSESTSLNIRKTFLSAFLLGSLSTINSELIEYKVFNYLEAFTVGLSIKKASLGEMEYLQSVALNATIRRLVNSLFPSIATFTNPILGITSFSRLLSKILVQKQSEEGNKTTENSSKESSSKQRNKTAQDFCNSLKELMDQPTEVKLESIPFLTLYKGEEGLSNPNPDIIEKMYIITNQKKLNHLILCGKAGSGKTSTVRFFINQILSGKYKKLQGSEIYKLDASALGSNSGIVGTIADKIQKFQKYIQLRKDEGIHKIIVYIDEIHQLCGMGTHRDNSNDVWQFLKEKLADPFIIILGTTTEEEYKKHIAKDEALKSRLTKLDFPSPTDSIKEEIIESQAKECVKYYPSLIDMTEHQIKEVIQRAKTKAEEECPDFSKGSSKLNLRDVLKCLWFEFSVEDVKRAEAID